MSVQRAAAERSRPGAKEWPARLRSACRGDGVRTVLQPIADLAAARPAGYEALVRFGTRSTSPLTWFGAARRYGCAGQLEAVALRSALRARSGLPPNCFLSVNVSPDQLRHPAIRAVWRDEGDLSRIVVELTEHAPVDSYVGLEPALDALRAAGAVLAVDDAGAGYAGLRHLLTLRPAMIKLDASLVRGIDRDEAKRALTEMLGTFAASIDAWIVAEGVEEAGELETLAAMGVPLAQGYFLAEPASGWGGLSDRASAVLRSTGPRSCEATLRGVLESAPVAGDLTEARAKLEHAGVPLVVLLDRYERPVTVLTAQHDQSGAVEQGMRANLDTPLAEAAQRAMTRTTPHRFTPLLCTDNAGRFVGIVRMERLVLALASRELTPAEPEDANARS